MKKIVIIGLKLSVICAVSAIILAFVNSVTAPAIEYYKKAAVEEALKKIAGGGDIGEQTLVGDNPAVQGYYPASFPDKGEGFILRLTGAGYGGDMAILAGFLKDGAVYSVVLMDNQETPGLGKNAERPEYMTKFLSKGGDEPVPLLKDNLSKADADAVSGATITFLGVAKALAEGSGFVKDLRGGQ